MPAAQLWWLSNPFSWPVTLLPGLLLLPGAAGFGTLPPGQGDNNQTLLGRECVPGTTGCSRQEFITDTKHEDIASMTGRVCMKEWNYSFYTAPEHPCFMLGKSNGKIVKGFVKGTSGHREFTHCQQCEKDFCKCFDLDDEKKYPEKQLGQFGLQEMDFPQNAHCRQWKLEAQDKMKYLGYQDCPDFTLYFNPVTYFNPGGSVLAGQDFLDDFCTLRLSLMEPVASIPITSSCEALTSGELCQSAYFNIGTKQYPCEWDVKNSRCQSSGTYYECGSFCFVNRKNMFDLGLSQSMADREVEYPELKGILRSYTPQTCGQDQYLSKDPSEGELACDQHFVYGFKYEDELGPDEININAVPCKAVKEWVFANTQGWKCRESPTEACSNMAPMYDDAIPEGYCKLTTSSTIDPNLLKVDLASGEWCNTDPARRADKDECERHYHTGSNGRVYPCFYVDKACRMKSNEDSIMCCDHLSVPANRAKSPDVSAADLQWCGLA